MSKSTLSKKIFIQGFIWVETGLHIGGTNAAMNIGGIDKAVVRDPITREPYLPGSSLKGKMRCLFELLNGEIGGGMGGNVKNGVSGNPASKSCQLFGTAADKKDKGEQAISRPSRLIVRDARMCTDPDALKHTDLLYTEQKTEVGIDRLTSAANPRQFERVPAGTCFRLDLVLNVFTGDAEADEKELVDNTIAAMRLLQDDALGGQGSRGYGKIAIEVTQVLEKTNEHYTTNKPASESSLKNVFVSHFKAPAWAANGNELFKLKAEYTKERTATK